MTTLRLALQASIKDLPPASRRESPHKTFLAKDQFFTKPEVARACVNNLLNHLEREGVDLNNAAFIEPSAGSGVFVTELVDAMAQRGIDQPKIEAYDKYTDNAPRDLNAGFEIVQRDFIRDLSHEPAQKKVKLSKEAHETVVYFGNPPFGKGGDLALDFLHQASKLGADYIGFILPPTFANTVVTAQYWQVENLEVQSSTRLNHHSFFFPDGKEKGVTTFFQIYKRGKTKKPQFPDFKDLTNKDSLWINNTFTIDTTNKRSGYHIYISHTRNSNETEPKITKKRGDIKQKNVVGINLYKLKGRVDDIISLLTDEVNWDNFDMYSCKPDGNRLNVVVPEHVKRALCQIRDKIEIPPA